jgi:hypothetical protein
MISITIVISLAFLLSKLLGNVRVF